MNKNLLILFLILLTTSCTTPRQIEKPCYTDSKTIIKIHWNDKLVVDEYILLKKNYYFEYSQRLVGLAATDVYHGTYTRMNDTLLFYFCGDTIPKLLTQKVLIDTAKNRITLLSKNPKLNLYYTMDFQKGKNKW